MQQTKLCTSTESREETQSGTLSENTCVRNSGLKTINLQVILDLKEFYLQAALVAAAAAAEECSWFISHDKPALRVLTLALNTHKSAHSLGTCACSQNEINLSTRSENIFQLVDLCQTEPHS